MAEKDTAALARCKRASARVNLEDATSSVRSLTFGERLRVREDL
jgi:hypothetical protein